MIRLLLLILPIVLFAKTVSFDEAISLTIKNNKELKAKKLDIAKAKQSIKEANGYKLGKVEFNENVSRTNNALNVFGMKLMSREATFGDFGFNTADFGALNQMMQNGQEIGGVQPNDLNNPDARNNFESKFIYEAPLFTGYKLENAKAMAKIQVMATNAKYLSDEKKIGLEVLKAYNGAVTAKSFIAMLKKAKVITNRFTAISQDMYKNKLTRIIDVKQAKMAGYTIDTQLKEAKVQFDLAIAYLQFLTNDNSITDVKDFKIFKLKSTNLTALQDMAINNRDDYEWMKHNVSTMKTKIAYESSDKYPTIGTHLEYGMNDDTISPSLKKDYYLMAVGLKYTLFDGEVSNINQQKARIDFAKTKHYLNYMKDGIALEVKKNYLEFRNKMQTLKEKSNLSKMSKEILLETENIYKNNLKFRTNMMYLLMNLENMLKAQANEITARYKLGLSSGKLNISVGNSLKKDR